MEKLRERQRPEAPTAGTKSAERKATPSGAGGPSAAEVLPGLRSERGRASFTWGSNGWAPQQRPKAVSFGTKAVTQPPADDNLGGNAVRACSGEGAPSCTTASFMRLFLLGVGSRSDGRMNGVRMRTPNRLPRPSKSVARSCKRPLFVRSKRSNA